MTPHCRIAAVTGLVLAAAVHAAPACLQDNSTAEIEGGNTELASQGGSFANMVAGMQATEVRQEITDANDVTEQAHEPPIEHAKKPLVEPLAELPAETPVERTVAQQTEHAVESQAEPSLETSKQEVVRPTQQPTKVEPAEKATSGPQLQDLLAVTSAPLFQETPLAETLEPQRTTPQQSQHLPQKTAVKPAEQVQAAPKLEPQTPVPEPKPKPKPKPRGNSAQNAVQGLTHIHISEPTRPY